MDAVQTRRVPLLVTFMLIGLLVFAFLVAFNQLTTPAQSTTPEDQAASESVTTEHIPIRTSEFSDTDGGQLDGETYLNPFNSTLRAEDFSEETTQRHILGLAKQKIHAEVKTSFYEITPERLDWLSGIVDSHPEYVHQDLYMEILSRWRTGDFSQAVEDHNTIWAMLGGEVGKAERLATPQEEAAYIEHRKRR